MTTLQSLFSIEYGGAALTFLVSEETASADGLGNEGLSPRAAVAKALACQGFVPLSQSLLRGK